MSVDYSRAFDSISHAVLLEKLHRTYGFRGPILNWISSFITNRMDKGLFLVARSSDFVPVLSGVHPRDQSWGPCVFNIYVNDLNLHLRFTQIFQYRR